MERVYRHRNIASILLTVEVFKQKSLEWGGSNALIAYVWKPKLKSVNALDSEKIKQEQPITNNELSQIR